jgi:N-acetylmuramoyl-L-alanine amidase
MPTPVPTPTPTPGPPKVGIVAGHWKYDSGAICDDGLQEVQINLDVARRVARLLRQDGYDAEVLAEFAPELNGYKAAAFVAIHSDSCLNIPEATGFKVARVTNSAVPRQEDALVACLWSEYGRATGLPPHPGSITRDMRQYHAFRQIAPNTPGAIIELGFMYNDRDLLTKQPNIAALGVANGIRCFLEQTHPSSSN